MARALESRKKIGGKWYRLDGAFKTKEIARKRRDEHKAEGYNARVLPTPKRSAVRQRVGKRYMVYRRRKR